MGDEDQGVRGFRAPLSVPPPRAGVEVVIVAIDTHTLDGALPVHRFGGLGVGPARGPCWRVNRGAGHTLMLLFVAFCLELPVAELALEPLFDVCYMP